jgi:hypothetical protein
VDLCVTKEEASEVVGVVDVRILACKPDKIKGKG